MHEPENLFLQCTSCGGSTSEIIKEWMRSDILALGTCSITEAQLDLYLAHNPSSRQSSPWLLFLLLQHLAGQCVHWDEILENEGADNPFSLISLSFLARLRVGGERALGSAAEAPDITRERRALRVWRQQPHALIEAASASPGTDIDWQVYLLQWTTLPHHQIAACRRHCPEAHSH